MLDTALGFALAGATLALRWSIDPLLGDRQPFTPAYAAVALAIWYRNPRCAVIVAVLCHLWANYFFISPRHEFSFSTTELVGGITYYLIAGLLIFLGHRAQTANKRLLDEDRQKDRFIATLSHELRNPLGAISNVAASLKMTAHPDENTRRNVEILERQSRHFTGLLNNLLDVARITENRIHIEYGTLDSRRCIEDVLEIVRPQLLAKNQTLHADLPDEPVHVEADPTRLKQILVNLLDNASKYSQSGATITVTVRTSLVEVIICVSDNGPGIESNKLRRLFESFHAAGRDIGHTGLGIGLWITKRLVELHGGHLSADSSVGQGSRFCVHLPRERLA